MTSCAASSKERVPERFSSYCDYMVEQQRKIVAIQSRYPKGSRPHVLRGLGIQKLHQAYEKTAAYAQANYGIKLDNQQLNVKSAIREAAKTEGKFSTDEALHRLLTVDGLGDFTRRRGPGFGNSRMRRG